MAKEIVTAPAAGKPVGPYSQAVVVGDMIFVSGEKGVDPKSGQIVPGGVRAQTAQTIENIGAILEAAGASLNDVVRCVVYMADNEDFSQMNEVYASFFSDPRPARSTVVVAGLPMDLQILIEATAIKGCGS